MYINIHIHTYIYLYMYICIYIYIHVYHYNIFIPIGFLHVCIHTQQSVNWVLFLWFHLAFRAAFDYDWRLLRQAWSEMRQIATCNQMRQLRWNQMRHFRWMAIHLKCLIWFPPLSLLIYTYIKTCIYMYTYVCSSRVSGHFRLWLTPFPSGLKCLFLPLLVPFFLPLVVKEREREREREKSLWIGGSHIQYFFFQREGERAKGRERKRQRDAAFDYDWRLFRQAWSVYFFSFLVPFCLPLVVLIV